MRRSIRTSVPTLAALLIGATTAHAQYTVYGLRDVAGAGQQLVTFNTSNPNLVTTVGATGATLTGIDFRPANNVLYGYNGTSVFTVNTATGAATSLFTPTATAVGNGGFDFNPVPDRLRVISPTGTNLRLNVNPPFTAANTIVDGFYTFAVGDANVGTPSFTAAAYTNNDNDPGTGTTLFGIDSNRGVLITITNPNGGTVNTVGSLGLAQGTVVSGFDILTIGSSNLGFLSTVTTAGTGAFYTINLGTGATTFQGSIGTVGAPVVVADIAIAAVPEPGTWALLATGLAGLAGVARRRRTNA